MADLLGTQLPITVTPLQESGATGSQSLDSAQRQANIGAMAPIVFGKRVGTYGGVLVSPPATECRFETYVANVSGIPTTHVRARYQLVLAEGVIDRPQTRDVFQQSCRVGSSATAYNTRAGLWTPGNFLPNTIDAPRFCGTGGTYEGLTMLSFTNGIPAQFDQWRKQVHCFVRGGLHVTRLVDNVTGSSNNYADLALYLINQSSRLPSSAVDASAFARAARFLAANSLTCDCIIDNSQNLSTWIQETAPIFLLQRSRIGGKEALRPLLPTNIDGTLNLGFIRWAYTFTTSDIAEFEVSYTSLTDRKPFVVLAIWRQQPDDDIGLIRTTEVRYVGTGSAGPYEQHDFSKYVTNEDHAVKVATYILARRKYVEHTLRIVVKPGTFNGALSIGDIVRVKYESTDDTNDTLVHNYLYEIDSIGKSLSGAIEYELTHFPIDAEGSSLIALDVSRAKGSGNLMPTGREAVTCDINSSTDSTPWPVVPTPDWDPDFDIDLDVPIGVDDWEYDEEEDEWVTDDDQTEDDIVDDADPDNLFPDEPPGGAGSGGDPDEDKQEDGEGTPEWWSESAAVTIEDLELRYQYDSFGGSWQQPDYAIVTGRAVIDQPPLTNIAIDMAFGDEEFTVIIPKVAVSPMGAPEVGPYFNWFAFRTNIATPFFCESQSISSVRWRDGDFKTVVLPTNVPFNICPYVGTITANSFGIEPSDPDVENSPLVIRGEFAVDNIPVTSSLLIAISIGNPLYAWDIKVKAWKWKGASPRPPEPTVYELEIPGIVSRFTEEGWEWDVFEKEWVYRFPDEPPTGSPPAPVANPEAVEFEFPVPSSYNPDNDELRIIYAANGGFSSHVLPDLGGGGGIFDYYVIEYALSSGEDLDTRTSFLVPMIDEVIGWAQGDSIQDYLEWGGDNQSDTGVESAAFFVSNFTRDYPNQTVVEFDTRGMWFDEPGINVELRVVGFNGGTMIKDNLGGWVNDTSERTVIISEIVPLTYASGTTSDPGERLRIIVIDLESGQINFGT